ncbi:MAG: methylenetetrahydrofolate--tRNA-(uracil(54)-C(5))-methyltransferase (FADH(2)-oxidizing) TrmFO [Alphaproteobacteria bacterium]
MTQKPLHIIGGGLAGCEAAHQATALGVPVILHEMRPVVSTFAHQTSGLAELVCSNSFRSDDHTSNAVGVLHQEMRLGGSLVMQAAGIAQVPAGSALAVDRDVFSNFVEEAIIENPLITIEREEVTELPPGDWGHVIIATGPLTSTNLAKSILAATDEDSLAFFDAIAPIVYAESINFDVVWAQSRYDKPGPGGTGKDYLNCPMNEEQYNAFIDAMLAAEMTEFKDWEKDTPYFEGCLPVEVMAERGRETLRYGPMKPVGLTNPNSDEPPYAVVQLRQDNKEGTLYNLVGFQTKMKHGAQKEVFRSIPGLEGAEFARLGGIHRNTFINSPRLLDDQMRLKSQKHIRFAGQITGVEGYVESSAMGGLAGRLAAAEMLGLACTPPPLTTAHGSLINHISGGANADTFQPMNINFGLMPMMEAPRKDAEGNRLRGKAKGRAKKALMAAKALSDYEAWVTAAPFANTTNRPIAS